MGVYPKSRREKDQYHIAVLPVFKRISVIRATSCVNILISNKTVSFFVLFVAESPKLPTEKPGNLSPVAFRQKYYYENTAVAWDISCPVFRPGSSL